MRSIFTRMLSMLLLFCFLTPIALSEALITIVDEDGEEVSIEIFEEESVPSQEEPEPALPGGSEARAAFIDGIIALAKEKYDEAGGRAQLAHYSGDIYVCKNFTVYLFKENADKFRMAEYPDTELVIPDNLPKDQCVEYVDGREWKDVPAEDGNPF